MMTDNKLFVGNANNENEFLNININRVLKKALKYWWVFAISIFLCVAAAIVYNHYARHIYTVEMVVLLKSDNRLPEMYQLTEGFGLTAEMTDLENQRFLLTSPKMVEKAIDKLDFEISYFTKGYVKSTEVYGHDQLLTVRFDTSHQQPIGAKFEALILDDGTISLSVKGEEIWGYDYNARDYTDYNVVDIDTTFIVRPNEKITNRMFSFEIIPAPVSPYLTDEERENRARLSTIFYFNAYSSLVAQWRASTAVSIDTEGGTVAYVTTSSTNYRKALAFQNKLNEASIEFSLEKKNDMATRTLEFLKIQLKTTADSLLVAQNRVKLFKQRNNFADIKQHISSLQTTYQNNEEEIRQLMLQQQYLTIIDKKLESNENIEDFFIAAATTDNSLLQRQLQELTLMQSTLLTLKDQSDNNPYKRQAVENMNMLRNNLTTLIKQTLSINKIKIDEMQKNNGDLLKYMETMPELEQEYVNLERSNKILESVYTFLQQKESETLIAKASNTADTDVLQDPTYRGTVAPNHRNNLMVAFVLGLVLPFLPLVIFEIVNKKIRDRDDIRRIIPNVNLLGMIPLDSSADHTPTLSAPRSTISESFRTLRAKLNFIAHEKQQKTIIVSSCDTFEGKTFCAINIAICMAIAGKKTVILNYDLRRPNMEKYLASRILTQRFIKGVTDYLVGEATAEEILHKSEVSDNLYIVPAGTIPPNPSELIESDINKAFLENIRKDFDVVVIDTAPVGCVADCRPLEPFADIFLFVIRANYTDIKHLEDTVNSLDNSKLPHFIFNGTSFEDNKYHHYYSRYNINQGEA